jgi:hypothetical protein
MLAEDNAAIRQSVNVWRLDLVRAVETEVIPALFYGIEATALWFMSCSRKKATKNQRRCKKRNAEMGR